MLRVAMVIELVEIWLLFFFCKSKEFFKRNTFFGESAKIFDPKIPSPQQKKRPPLTTVSFQPL
jgi:hypothetical protein